MAGLSQAIRAALQADPTAWPGPLDKEARARFSRALRGLPEDVRDMVLACLVDPEQRLWSCGTLLALRRLQAAGAEVVGLAHDDVVEFTDAGGQTFGLVAVDADPGPALGLVPHVEELLGLLDSIFGDRGFIVHFQRPLTTRIDLDSVARAVRLWLSESSKGPPVGQRALYEDDDVSVELTIAEGRGRRFTLGPIRGLERLHAIERQLAHQLAVHEAAVGDLPLVMVLTSREPAPPPRGYVQLQLYGPAKVVASGPEPSTYQAWFPDRGSSMFHDRMFQHLTSLWWLSPRADDDPLASDVRAYDNPWARVPLALDLTGPRFVCLGRETDGTAHCAWQR